MARKFSELRPKMTPEAQARAAERARAMALSQAKRAERLQVLMVP